MVHFSFLPAPSSSATFFLAGLQRMIEPQREKVKHFTFSFLAGGGNMVVLAVSVYQNSVNCGKKYVGGRK